MLRAAWAFTEAELASQLEERARGYAGAGAPAETKWRVRGRHSSARRSRNAFAITESELKVIAAAAIIGLSSRPATG
jgi:hypothetical protein